MIVVYMDSIQYSYLFFSWAGINMFKIIIAVRDVEVFEGLLIGGCHVTCRGRYF